MYEVNIAADPEQFIDWDKPLSEQSDFVRDVLTKRLTTQSENTARSLGYENFKSDPNSFLDVGGHTFRPMNEAMASELLEAGIPGIKFLDAGSRGTPAPAVKPVQDGYEVYWGNDPRPVDKFPTKEAAEAAAREIDGRSRNYVVFDDRLISIIRKYGIAGASVMLGYNLMEQLDPKQALAATMADKDYQESSDSRMQGGRVTGGNPHGNDNPAVSRAIALTREY